MRQFVLAAAAAAAVAITPSASRAGAPIESLRIDGGYARIAVDAAGSIYGFKQGPDYSDTIVNRGWLQSVRVEKLDAAGNLLWGSNNLGNWPDDLIVQSPVDVALDPSGNAVTLQFEQCWASFHTDGAVMRYDAASGAQTFSAPPYLYPDWQFTPSATWNAPIWLYFGRYQAPKAIATDAAGNVYAAGYAITGGGWGDPYTYAALFTKIDAAYTGSYAQSPFITLPPEVVPDATQWQLPLGLAVGADGSVLVVGPAGTIKYDASFNVAWIAPFAGSAVAVDASGDVYVTGSSGTARLAAADGSASWTRDTIVGAAIVLDADGNVLVTGGPETVRLTSAGALSWTMAQTGNDIDVDAARNVYVLASGTVQRFAPDEDGDGYSVVNDCNDGSASIHPGAAEVRFDGIDQDCNGYDLTIDVTKALYQASAGSMRVEATSALGPAANLQVVGRGPMKYDPLANKWVLTVGKLAVDPRSVTVFGVEGSVTVPTAQK